MYTEKDVLVKTMFTNEFCRYEPVSKRPFIVRKQTDSPVKKKFPAQRSKKKVMVTVFWNMKGTNDIDFF